MIANNYFSDDPELVLFFEHLVDWKAVVAATEGKDFFDHRRYAETGDERFALAPSNVAEAVDLYRSTLESLGEFCGKEVSQIAPTLDRAGLTFESGQVRFPPEAVNLFERYRKTGLIPYAVPRFAGGLGLPTTIAAFYSMIMGRSDASFCMTQNLTNLAQIVTRYGTEEQAAHFAAPAATGETLFAMALSEPDFGSDLSNVRTTATRQADGSYRITGTKRFISQGCGLGPYPSTLLTLARTNSRSGARGLSVFLVKGSDVEIAGIERKMGIHASPTCEVVYENAPAQLLGQEGQGLTRCTLGMTNFMRLASAAGAAGGGAVALSECEKYARERIQFGRPIAEIPAVAAMLETIRRETMAMRLLAIETASAIDLYQHEQIRMEQAGLSDREIRGHAENRYRHNVASLLSPIAKVYCSETALRCASLAVQIHGGAGYTEDYDVARLYRDARINTIYEGTTQLLSGIAAGGIAAGLGEAGTLRRLLVELQGAIPNYRERLLGLPGILEEALPLYQNLKSGVRERFSEELVMFTARLLCSMLLERAHARLSSIRNADGVSPELLDRWQYDCRLYHLDGGAMGAALLYRLKNVEQAR
ncbi:MAG: acyl-CoA dehydrogenase family protein [Spirochaetales bacterium]|nr:acyl-CoA dehydrogenase family protein [Leptospiraceae bacterium]MCP5480534.1 acyl-CoA dehydrogenase family protein [Spirochaetales bacterium]